MVSISITQLHQFLFWEQSNYVTFVQDMNLSRLFSNKYLVKIFICTLHTNLINEINKLTMLILSCDFVMNIKTFYNKQAIKRNNTAGVLNKQSFTLNRSHTVSKKILFVSYSTLLFFYIRVRNMCFNCNNAFPDFKIRFYSRIKATIFISSIYFSVKHIDFCYKYRR